MLGGSTQGSLSLSANSNTGSVTIDSSSTVTEINNVNLNANVRVTDIYERYKLKGGELDLDDFILTLVKSISNETRIDALEEFDNKGNINGGIIF